MPHFQPSCCDYFLSAKLISLVVNYIGRIFITGSADGLGQLAAKELVNQGHEVVLHVRNEVRSEQALQQVPGAADVLTGDLSAIDETKALADQANALGTFDAVIHNAGVYIAPVKQLLHVNTLAPYILTGLMHRSQRLIYSFKLGSNGPEIWQTQPRITIDITEAHIKTSIAVYIKIKNGRGHYANDSYDCAVEFRYTVSSS